MSSSDPTNQILAMWYDYYRFFIGWADLTHPQAVVNQNRPDLIGLSYPQKIARTYNHEEFFPSLSTCIYFDNLPPPPCKNNANLSFIFKVIRLTWKLEGEAKMTYRFCWHHSHKKCWHLANCRSHWKCSQTACWVNMIKIKPFCWLCYDKYLIVKAYFHGRNKCSIWL